MDDDHLIALASQLLAVAGMMMEDLSPELISLPPTREHASILISYLVTHIDISRDLAIGAQALLNIATTGPSSVE